MPPTQSDQMPAHRESISNTETLFHRMTGICLLSGSTYSCTWTVRKETNGEHRWAAFQLEKSLWVKHHTLQKSVEEILGRKIRKNVLSKGLFRTIKKRVLCQNPI